MKSMIFAAGLGTRLKPITDTLPKALVPVAGKPLIEHVTRKLSSYGIREVVVNVHSFADKIEDYYNKCLPKQFDDDFKKNAYIAFWNEWRRRRNGGVKILNIPYHAK